MSLPDDHNMFGKKLFWVALVLLALIIGLALLGSVQYSKVQNAIQYIDSKPQREVLQNVYTTIEQVAKSNYDLAVEGGFTGTQQEYLDSLKGDEGKKGEDSVSTVTIIEKETSRPIELGKDSEGNTVWRVAGDTFYRVLPTVSEAEILR